VGGCVHDGCAPELNTDQHNPPSPNGEGVSPGAASVPSTSLLSHVRLPRSLCLCSAPPPLSSLLSRPFILCSAPLSVSHAGSTLVWPCCKDGGGGRRRNGSVRVSPGAAQGWRPQLQQPRPPSRRGSPRQVRARGANPSHLLGPHVRQSKFLEDRQLRRSGQKKHDWGGRGEDGTAAGDVDEVLILRHGAVRVCHCHRLGGHFAISGTFKEPRGI